MMETEAEGVGRRSTDGKGKRAKRDESRKREERRKNSTWD
jgi:hypothetical protein